MMASMDGTDVATDPRVVYVVRDPRDVVVSFHHHQLRSHGPLSAISFLGGGVRPHR